jgi:hypothetical protein
MMSLQIRLYTMDKEISVIQLANAVQWWMSYISAVGRDYVLSESSIKYPLAEYLGAKLGKEKLKLEFGHPKLSNKRLDLHYEDAKNNKTAIEFKFIKNGSTRDKDEKKRVFNDLMRLFLFIENSEKGYFLICGAQNEFSENFSKLLSKPPKTNKTNPYITPETKVAKTLKTSSKGFYSEWFSFSTKKPEKKISIDYNKKGYGDIYKSFKADYEEIYKKTTKTTELPMPDTLTTKLLYLSQETKSINEFYEPTTIGIWEIIKETTDN